ncbi:hypothetical protein OEZ85_006102 [Tetradesmus obliquus]|uniref:Pentacotripeptide-repeat region of PRORP domain-containing protein n=1 Tax=Tetradesmus obliquus TaxID=3088 RepID=A0ABY8UKX3_TETOB|nr:hypothetical protein OEZ85_006102 [Tetradesmus obliquus]
MQQLLSMRHVPKECTAALVEAGVLPTWQQLGAAARSGHCIKQWLVACRRLVKPLPGMTALAEVALVAELDLLQPPSSSNLTQRMCQEQPSEDELVTVLHVALSTGTARGFLSLLSDKTVRQPAEQWQPYQQWQQQQRALLRQLPAAAAQELLVVAVIHETSYWEVHKLQHLLDEGEDHFGYRPDVPNMALWGDALTAAAKQHLSSGREDQVICMLNGSSRALTTAHICELLVAAAKGRANGAAEWLFKLDEAKRLHSMPEAVAELLLATAGHSVMITEQLCRFRPAKRLSAEQVTGVLAVAVTQVAAASCSKQKAVKELITVAVRHTPSHQELCTLQQLLSAGADDATVDLQEGMWGDALTAAAKQHLSSASELLARRVLVGRTDILSAAHIRELIIAAAKGHAEGAVDWLFQLHAARESNMAREAVAELLLATAGHSVKVTEQLCRMRAAKQLSAEQVTGVLAAAVSQMLAASCIISSSRGGPQPAQPLRKSVGSKQRVTRGPLHVLTKTYSRTAIAEEALLGWLRSAVQCNSSSTVDALCMLKAAQQLGGVPAAELLAAALQLGHAEAAEVLVDTFRTTAIASDSIFDLLQSAVQQDSTAVVKAMCRMGALSQLDVAALEGLFKVLQELEPQQAVELLLHALQHDNTAAASKISDGLPAAAQLATARNAGALLRLATAKGLMAGNMGRHPWFAAVAAQLRHLRGAKQPAAKR